MVFVIDENADGHPNMVGQEIIAGAVYDFMENEKLTPQAIGNE